MKEMPGAPETGSHADDRNAAATVAILLGLGAAASWRRGSPLLTLVCAALCVTLLLVAITLWSAPPIRGAIQRRRAARAAAPPMAWRPRRLRGEEKSPTLEAQPNQAA